MGAPGRLPAGVLRGDEDHVDEVGDNHHGAVEGQLLFPLGVRGRPKDAHDCWDDDPGQGLRHNRREAEEVALRYLSNQETSAAEICIMYMSFTSRLSSSSGNLKGGRDVLERGEPGEIAKHSEAAEHLWRKGFQRQELQ